MSGRHGSANSTSLYAYVPSTLRIYDDERKYKSPYSNEAKNGKRLAMTCK